MRPIPVVAAVCVLLGLASRAVAWDAKGHEQIADIAWTKLTPHAKSEITAILMAGDPGFRPASMSETDVRAAFDKAATFADVIKGDRTTTYEQKIQEMNPIFFVKSKPDPNNREDSLCKTWHYYDTPIRDKGDHPAPESNALQALTLARKSLAQLEADFPTTSRPNANRIEQCWWVYWIEHVTGDLHQPLHCVSSYEFFPDTGDAGGNKLTIQDPTNPRVRNLHSYWDGGITQAIAKDKQVGLPVTMEEVTKRWENDPMLAPSASDAANLDVAVWIKDGAVLADKVVYADLKQNSILTNAYTDAAITLSRKQAVLAGTRLAAVLNAALDQSGSNATQK